MKIFRTSSLALLVLLFLFQGCQQDEDDVKVPENLKIQDFIWKGMNLYYLWQADVPNLSDTKFANQAKLNVFLRDYPKPEVLFNALRVNENIDKFSWIVDDYIKLEGELQGTTNSNGVEFGLSYKTAGSSEIIGWVRYIVPNSNASTKNIKRGDIFYGVNGTTLTDKNYRSLLFGANDDYTLNMANADRGVFIPNGVSVALKKTELNENPILINTVITSGSNKIGYLMYNGFYSNYDTQLNDAFGTLKSQGITDLVLDLRYNGGGSILSATRLASMITGGLSGQVFSKTQWNAKVEAYYEANNPNSLKDFFTDKIGTIPINSLNLKRIYILTTASSASASELVINGLKPYISVIQIGDVTVGKNVGSITLYDSPTLGKENRNPKHRYAMQPLVIKVVNKNGFGDYQSGLVPTFRRVESISDLGVLGNSSEPLLQLAIAKITGTGKIKPNENELKLKFFTSAKDLNRTQNQMYLEKIPVGLYKVLE